MQCLPEQLLDEFFRPADAVGEQVVDSLATTPLLPQQRRSAGYFAYPCRAPRGGPVLGLRTALRGDRAPLLPHRAAGAPRRGRARRRHDLRRARGAGRRAARRRRLRRRPPRLRAQRDAALPGADLRARSAGAGRAHRPSGAGRARGVVRARARAHLRASGRGRRAGRAGDRAGPRTRPERASPRAGQAEPRRARGRVRIAPGVLRAHARLDRHPGRRTCGARRRRRRTVHRRGIRFHLPRAPGRAGEGVALSSTHRRSASGRSASTCWRTAHRTC